MSTAPFRDDEKQWLCNSWNALHRKRQNQGSIQGWDVSFFTQLFELSPEALHCFGRTFFVEGQMSTTQPLLLQGERIFAVLHQIIDVLTSPEPSGVSSEPVARQKHVAILIGVCLGLGI